MLNAVVRSTVLGTLIPRARRTGTSTIRHGYPGPPAECNQPVSTPYCAPFCVGVSISLGESERFMNILIFSCYRTQSILGIDCIIGRERVKAKGYQ